MSRTYLCLLALCVALFCPHVIAQEGNTVTVPFVGVPTGGCGVTMNSINTTNGDFYNCPNGAWNKVSTTGGGAVTSVFGRNGVVVAATNDYTLAQISATFSSPLSLASATLSCPTCVVASAPSVGIAHFAGSTQMVTSSAVDLSSADATGVLAAARFPALTGDTTTSSGSLATSVVKVNGAAVPASGFSLKTNSSSQLVAAPASYASGTTTTSITAVTLCTTTNCPAGTYLVSVYINETGTGCTTVVTGAVKVQLNYIDNQAVTRSAAFVPTQASTGGIYAAAGTSFTTGGNASGMGFAVVNTNGSAVAGSDSIQIQSTATACGTPGSWTGYQVRAFLTPVG